MYVLHDNVLQHIIYYGTETGNETLQFNNYLDKCQNMSKS